MTIYWVLNRNLHDDTNIFIFAKLIFFYFFLIIHLFIFYLFFAIYSLLLNINK